MQILQPGLDLDYFFTAVSSAMRRALELNRDDIRANHYWACALSALGAPVRMATAPGS
jgi:hypothetical protein